MLQGCPDVLRDPSHGRPSFFAFDVVSLRLRLCARSDPREVPAAIPTFQGSCKKFDRIPAMLRFLTAGESHGQALVVIVEGVPAGLPLDGRRPRRDLRRRQRGYGRGRRMAIEQDRAEILSGVRRGETLGSPIALLIRNGLGELAAHDERRAPTPAERWRAPVARR